MLQIMYVSSAWPPMTQAQVDAILETSRRNNARDGLTGLLVHDGRRFLQVLEGQEAAVREAIARIRADMRHRAMVILSERTIAVPDFGAWSMAYDAVPDAGERAIFSESVEAMVAGVTDPNTRALFKGFAAIDRRAA